MAMVDFKIDLNICSYFSLSAIFLLLSSKKKKKRFVLHMLRFFPTKGRRICFADITNVSKMTERDIGLIMWSNRTAISI